MCGIFSYLGKNFSFAELVTLSNKIKHRGPDSSNNVSLYFDDKEFFLGFHRLAINGLDEISNQPLMDNDNEIYLIANAEIFNYKELIKEKQPIYNRKLRKNHFPFGLFDELDSNGYIRLKVKSSAEETAYPIASFTSKKEGTTFLLKIIEKYKLCQKLCDLYNSSGGCFQYSVKTCDGACINKINPNEYNQRVNDFVTTITMENKTFYILDKGRTNSEKSLVLIENGTYRGHGFAPFHFHGKEAKDWKKYIDEQKENKDIRTIINQFIRKGQIERMIEI